MEKKNITIRVPIYVYDWLKEKEINISNWVTYMVKAAIEEGF